MSCAPDRFDELHRRIVYCTCCPLWRTRTHAVPGQGSWRAGGMLFVGEAPGQQEDEQGLAFVGRSGQLLTRLLAEVGIARDDIFITNIVKCRPPGNRTPSDHEVERCLPFLREQVRLLAPALVVTLGSTALKALVDASAAITRVHGQTIVKGSLTFFATYHPAAVLRSSSLLAAMSHDLGILATKWRTMHADHHRT
jgi:uracil-DNA glycosylase